MAVTAVTPIETIEADAALIRRTTRQGRPDVLGELAPEYKVFKPVGHRLLGRFSFEGRRSTAPLRQALRAHRPQRRLAPMGGRFAAFERAMIGERTSAGLAQARAEGRVGGRRRKLTPKQRAAVAESVLSGRQTAAERARIFGVSQPTVSRIVAEHRRAAPGNGPADRG